MGEKPDQNKTVSNQLTTSSIRLSSDSLENEFHLSEEELAPIKKRYELIQLLGRGGMGVVYKARDLVSGDIVALKVIAPEIASHPKAIERFKAELRLARKITHKNVCRVYDLSQFGNIHALSMEFIEGETLRQILRRNETLSVRHGLKLIRQVINALDEAHRQGVVHRDLKPENILVSSGGEVKVMDFGLARSLAENASSPNPGAILGTPAYMSPEQAEGKQADSRSDIYALGLMLYEMFTGRRAFEADTPIALATKQIYETPVPPTAVEPDLPNHIEGAILRCLQKDPKKRFESVRKLESMLITRNPLDLQTPFKLESDDMPIRLVIWHRRDWFLATAGVLCLLGFIGMFDLVFPYNNFRLEISREVAIDKAHKVVTTYMPELTEGKTTITPAFLDDLATLPNYSLTSTELREAAQTFSRSWDVMTTQQGDKLLAASLGFNSKGDIVSIYLHRQPVEPILRISTPAENIEFSRRCVKDLFNLDVSSIQPRIEIVGPRPTEVWGWPNLPEGGVRAFWTVQSRALDKKMYVSTGVRNGRLYAAILAASPNSTASNLNYSTFVSLNTYREARQVGMGFFCLLGLIAIILSIVRRLYLRTEPAVLALSVISSAVFTYFLMTAEVETEWFWIGLAVISVCVLGVSYLALASPYYYFGRTFPTLTKSSLNLFRLRLKDQALGFSMLRGCCLGCLFLMGHVVVLWILRTLKIGGPNLMWFDLFRDSQHYVLSCFLLTVAVTIVAVWLFLAFPLSLLHRMRASFFVQLISIGIIWAAAFATLAGSSVFPAWLVYLVAGLQGIFFALVIFKWDLLSCTVAIFTAETWLLSYPLYRIFAKVDGLRYGMGLLAWIGLVLLGILIATRPGILAVQNALRAIFE